MDSGRAPASLRELRLEIEEFNAEYAAVLDAGRVQDWPQFFTEDAIYRITGRENADAGLPVGLVYCEGMGMLGDRALVSGNCVVHQYTRIGRLAMMRGLSRTSRDVPPFCIMDGTHTLRGINVVGLKRAGVPTKSIQALRKAFTTLFGTRQNLKLAVERLEKSTVLTPEVIEMVNFIRAAKRGVAFGPQDAHADDSDAES